MQKLYIYVIIRVINLVVIHLKKRTAKVLITSSEENHEYIVDIDENVDILTYTENNTTLVTLDRKNHRLIRENNEMLMDFRFDKEIVTKSSLYLKSLNNTLDMYIKTNEIKIAPNMYYVDYEILDNDKIIYKVEIGE